MDNKKQVKDPYRSALKKKAMAFMPKNYEDVHAQKAILSMIVAVVPAAAGCAQRAEAALWPKVQAKSLPIIQAVGQCALEVNKAIGAAPMESLMLEKRSSELLLKAWVALDYYSYLMLPEYSGNIRALRDRLFAILRQRDTGAAPGPRPAAPMQPPVRPAQPGPRPAPPMQPPVRQPMAPQPPMGMAEDINKTVVVERPNAGQAQDLNKTVTVEHSEAGQAEELGKTVTVEKTPELSEELEKTHFTPDREQNMFQEDGAAEEIGATVNVAREDIPGGKKAKKSAIKTPVIIAAAAVAVIAVVVGVLFMGGKSADKVEAAIDAIGEVTLESQEKIREAEALYEDLAGMFQKKVENRETLFAAREEYDRQVGAVAEVEDAIRAVGTAVTLESGSAIENARKLYDALEEDLKDDVSNYEELKTVEKTFSQLYSEEQAGILYNAAKAAYDSGDYATAVDKLALLLGTYSGTKLDSSAKDLGTSCCVPLAQQAMNENRLEEAKRLMDLVNDTFRITEDYNTLNQRLLNKLEGIRPVNGKLFAVKMDQGVCSMVITAKNSDLCIRLISQSDPEKYSMYYIREGETFAIYLKDGAYTLRYAYGEHWYGDEEMFGEDGKYHEIKMDFEVQTHFIGGKAEPDYYNFTLDVSANWDQKNLTREEF